MAKTNKTGETEVNVMDFLNSFVDSQQKKEDSLALIGIMRELTGFEPKMWGPTIIGFGSYHYKYESGHEGDAPIIGFSPRKPAFSLYILSHTESSAELLQKLGKFKGGKACIYIKKLSDIDISLLKALCLETINSIQAHHPNSATTIKTTLIQDNI